MVHPTLLAEYDEGIEKLITEFETELKNDFQQYLPQTTSQRPNKPLDIHQLQAMAITNPEAKRLLMQGVNVVYTCCTVTIQFLNVSVTTFSLLFYEDALRNQVSDHAPRGRDRSDSTVVNEQLILLSKAFEEYEVC